jgi:SPP1 gp7 family putative phage head morphogenesis protein
MARKNEIARRAKLKARHERLLERDLAKALAAYLAASAKAPKAITSISRKHQREIEAILRRRLLPIAMLFGYDTINRISSIKMAAPMLEHKDAQGFFGKELTRWLRRYAASRAKQITEGIRKIIAEIIAAANDEGLSERETGKRIRERAPQISKTRAERIARTETHSASEKASFDAAKALGIPIAKEWASAEDGRTRRTHAEIDGKTIGIDERFAVGDDALLYPGDMAGSAKEIVNCRCSGLYHPIIDGQIIR